MKRIALTTALIAGLAAPALASDQLAAFYGVDAGTVSAQELATLHAIGDSENDFATVEFKRDQFTGVVASTQSVGVSDGHAQLAASLGLNPDVYSVAELAVIRGESNEDIRAGLIEAYGSNGAIVSTQSVPGDVIERALKKSATE